MWKNIDIVSVRKVGHPIAIATFELLYVNPVVFGLLRVSNSITFPLILFSLRHIIGFWCAFLLIELILKSGPLQRVFRCPVDAILFNLALRIAHWWDVHRWCNSTYTFLVLYDFGPFFDSGQSWGGNPGLLGHLVALDDFLLIFLANLFCSAHFLLINTTIVQRYILWSLPAIALARSQRRSTGKDKIMLRRLLAMWGEHAERWYGWQPR